MATSLACPWYALADKTAYQIKLWEKDAKFVNEAPTRALADHTQISKH